MQRLLEHADKLEAAAGERLAAAAPMRQQGAMLRSMAPDMAKAFAVRAKGVLEDEGVKSANVLRRIVGAMSSVHIDTAEAIDQRAAIETALAKHDIEQAAALRELAAGEAKAVLAAVPDNADDDAPDSHPDNYKHDEDGEEITEAKPATKKGNSAPAAEA